jgi:hypothetical protein
VLARCRYRNSDEVTHEVQRLGPPGVHDRCGKLAENALIESLAERRPSSGPGAVVLVTPVTSLVEQHLVRLAKDCRSPVTLATYPFAVGKLEKFIGGVRVGEDNFARALQLAVMANVFRSNPTRDIQPLRSKTQPKGTVGLTGDQLRALLENVRRRSSATTTIPPDPITLLIATRLRRLGNYLACAGSITTKKSAHSA